MYVVNQNEEQYSQINVKSFYGGREKKCFPHSPKRRKAADKVLSKLDGDEVEEFLSLKGKVPGEVLKINNKVIKITDFQS
jgi:predicted alpha/beta superfamily hydrolase